MSTRSDNVRKSMADLRRAVVESGRIGASSVPGAADLWTRGWASIIDMILLFIPTWFDQAIGTGFHFNVGSIEGNGGWITVGWWFVVAAVTVWLGRSPGKWCMGLHIVSVNGPGLPASRPVVALRLFLKWGFVPMLGIQMIALLSFERFGIDPQAPSVVGAVTMSFAAQMLLGFGLYAALWPPHRGLHERLTGTQLARTVEIERRHQRGFTVTPSSVSSDNPVKLYDSG